MWVIILLYNLILLLNRSLYVLLSGRRLHQTTKRKPLISGAFLCPTNPLRVQRPRNVHRTEKNKTLMSLLEMEAEQRLWQTKAFKLALWGL